MDLKFFNADDTSYSNVYKDNMYPDISGNPYTPQYIVSVKQADIDKLIEDTIVRPDIDSDYTKDRLSLLKKVADLEQIDENKKNSVTKLSINEIVENFSDIFVSLNREGFSYFNNNSQQSLFYVGILILIVVFIVLLV
jgi:hypothetical protein